MNSLPWGSYKEARLRLMNGVYQPSVYGETLDPREFSFPLRFNKKRDTLFFLFLAQKRIIKVAML
jgi:hypothetical protein